MASRAILVAGRVVPVEGLGEWAQWFETANRHVRKDVMADVTVSTVFLGLDYGFGGPPRWFETMVFGGHYDQAQERYETQAEAIAGHEEWVVRVLEAITEERVKRDQEAVPGQVESGEQGSRP